MSWNDFVDIVGIKARQDANKANADRYQDAMGLWNNLYPQLQQGYGKSESLLGQLAPTINQGYGAASRLLGSAGQTAKQDIRAGGKQNMASINQSLTSRGLGNTTLLQNAQRGVQSDTSRRLSAVDESIGQMLAQLKIGQTSALTGALGQQASLYPSKFNALLGLTQGHTATIAEREDIAGKGWLGDVAGAFGKFYGMGGGGGG